MTDEKPDILDRCQTPLIYLIRALWVFVIIFSAIVFSGCTPPLPPNPTPDPDPPGPTPVVVGDWYLVFEESADRTEGTKEAVRVLLLSGKNFRTYDDDSDDAKPFLPKVAGIPLPSLLILDKDGNKLAARPLPQSAAEMQALIGGGQ